MGRRWAAGDSFTLADAAAAPALFYTDWAHPIGEDRTTLKAYRAQTLQVSMYWIRHTILTWVERNFGFAVAEAYAGHEDNRRGARSMGAMATYVRAGLPEVATALAALTGEPHPLAIKDPGTGPEDCGH